MRFRRLQLAAFGPFTDFELDFGAAARSDLQIVFGANEAGKSTALRAVRGLLFGIPERTDDAHRHPATELRVGAELVDESGRSLSVVRRRRRNLDRALITPRRAGVGLTQGRSGQRSPGS